MRYRDLIDRIERLNANRSLRNQINRVERYLAGLEAQSPEDGNPILFFNASTRIHRLSINAAFNLLASWRLRQEGVPVRYLVCQRGMTQCILGTNRENFSSPPPCKHCIPFSERLFPPDLVIPIHFEVQMVNGDSSRDMTYSKWYQ